MMPELIELAMFSGVLAVSFFVMLTGGTFFHERGHIIAARRYIPDMKAEMSLAGIAIPYMKIKGCTVKRKKFNSVEKSNGDTQMDYLKFTPNQIKHIAASGVTGANNFYAFTGGVSILIMWGIWAAFHLKGTLIILLFGVGSELLLCAIFVICSILKYETADTPYCDREIKKDPESFLRAKKEEAETHQYPQAVGLFNNPE